MDIHFDCLWKNKKFPEQCKNVKHKNEKCHCNLEPCPLYEKRGLFKLFKIKIINKI